MFRKISILTSLGLVAFSSFYAVGNPVFAQIVSDETVNTRVNQNGNIAEITGGETRGSNLFHSFQDFSISTDNTAFFDNANNISNIFSRVTGGNISNINGAIRANGNANLFLINPAGIIFGENARLDIGGSFYGSSASSILFDGGEFSAVDLTNPPLLTVNAPIGLGFRDNPGTIVNRSTVSNNDETVGLEVASGNNLTLLGGNIEFQGGSATARGGKIELGGLSQAGTIALNENGSPVYSPEVELSDITFVDNARISILGTGDGLIRVNANNLELNEGSVFLAGINEGSGEEIGGDIEINIRERLLLDGESFIISDVDNNAIGTSGNISIDASIIEIKNRSEVIARNNGRGNAGSITVNSDEILLQENAFFRTEIDDNTVGNAGDINITTNVLNLDDGLILSRIKNNTQGTSGDVIISANEAVNLNDGKIDILLESDSQSQAGIIDINSPVLNLENGSRIRSRNQGQGNSGDITVTSDRLLVDGESFIESDIDHSGVGTSGNINLDTSIIEVKNRSEVISRNNGRGNSGSITVNADEILLQENAFLRTEIDDNTVGDAGDINVTTEFLTVRDDAFIFSRVKNNSEGTSGDIIIAASETIELNDGKIETSLDPNSTGKAGKIDITTPSLSLKDNSRIRSRTLGQGDAGDITINASDRISIEDSQAGISSEVDSNDRENNDNNAIGNGGTITLNTKELLLNDSNISSVSFSRGDAGDIFINASDRVILNESIIFSNLNDLNSGNFDAVGDAGNITVETSELTLTNESRFIANTSGIGGVGNVTIDADDVNLDQMSLIISQIRGTGNGEGGRIEINADNISLKDFSLLSTNTSRNATGDAGDIVLNADRIDITQGAIVDAITENDSQGGNIDITSRTLAINTGGKIITSTDGGGNAGNINLTVTEDLNIDGDNPRLDLLQFSEFDEQILNDLRPNTGIFTSASESATGNGGSAFINAENLRLNNNAEISASTFFGTGGNINLNISDRIELENDSTISAQAFNEADGGNINIDTNFIIAFPNNAGSDGSDLVASADRGEGGNITISANSILGIAEGEATPENSTNDIDVSSDFGLDGRISITTPDTNTIEGMTELSQSVVDADKAVAQACRFDRNGGENSIVVVGRGGIPAEPGQFLNSYQILIDGEGSSPIFAVPEPIQTSKGKIQPARGIKLTKTGEIILTAYRTDNSGDRIINKSVNC